MENHIPFQQRNKRFQVLIVEDNITYRTAFKNLLSARFPLIIVREAGNGEDAMRKLDEFHPELIFMDIRLPDESGLELTKKIKNLYPEIKIIILTAYNLVDYRKASIENGADYFVPKGSTTTNDIMDLVESMISSSGI